jgi:hypothetical protein
LKSFCCSLLAAYISFGGAFSNVFLPLVRRPFNVYAYTPVDCTCVALAFTYPQVHIANLLQKLDIDREIATATATATATALTIDTETPLRYTMKLLFALAVLCCITTGCAKVPWGLPVARRCCFVGPVKTGSAKENLHAADLTDCTLGDDATPIRDGDGIPPSNSTMPGGYDIPPSNTPPSKKHAHHKRGFMSSFGENAAEKMANGHVEASEKMATAAEKMANWHVEASTKASANIVEASTKASANIRDGMYAIAACVVVSALLGRGGRS